MHCKRSNNEGTYHLKEHGVFVTVKKKVDDIFNKYFSLIQNVGEEHDSDSNVAVVTSVHPSIAAIREECVAAQFEFNNVSVAETDFIIKSLSNYPGKVDSNFFCYAATVLSPHRNVLIFTQRMHKPT